MPYGYATQGDVLVNQLADGTSLDSLWRTIESVLSVWNDERGSVARLLSYPTVVAADPVPQKLNSITMERASEFGVPVSVAPPKDVLKLGYTFEDWDSRTGFTWKFLREANIGQVTTVINDILFADSKLVNGTVIRRILNPTEEFNEYGHRCVGLWNGDGVAPLPHMGVNFDGAHTHYIASGASVLDSTDVEDAMASIVQHGYGQAQGSQLLILANPNEGQYVQSWRAGVESRPGGPKAKFDFVHSPVAPPYLTSDHIVGQQAPADFHNLPVTGSYGRAWLLESNYVPSGYVIVAASGGPDSPDNPVAIRSHTNSAYQGLRRIAGNGKYPLQDSFFQRSFGVGVRHRSAAVAIQVTPNVYTAPADSQIFV